jgi:hypothetical protein
MTRTISHEALHNWGQSGGGVVCSEGAEEGRWRWNNKSGGSRGQPMAVPEQARSDAAGVSASVSEGCLAVVYW